ncbi:DUF2197 domain-containing protein [Paenibacillus sepulcri]|uniref:DUF2197 domain-containing protein n=1 Tax=Paenibacillus sepulcri TaxID=359917 RepID=A0ABS7CC50_9BACL|nr:DUF2197 domain-containing protein [Paenibacillus sepulcri]
MADYEVQCYLCKKKFKAMAGTKIFKQVKQNRKGMHCCEECKWKVELEARLNFGRRLL